MSNILPHPQVEDPGSAVHFWVEIGGNEVRFGCVWE